MTSKITAISLQEEPAVSARLRAARPGFDDLSPLKSRPLGLFITLHLLISLMSILLCRNRKAF